MDIEIKAQARRSVDLAASMVADARQRGDEHLAHELVPVLEAMTAIDVRIEDAYRRLHTT